MTRILTLLVVLAMLSCKKQSTEYRPPNILWLVAEDLSAYIPPFGDSTVVTPNLSKLSAQGVRYTNVYSVSGVCAPSRCALITGMYPTHIGGHHMRTLYQQPAALRAGLINYEIVPPPDVKMVSEILRENGYYCTNNSKEDYQFHASTTGWDESSLFAHWRNRAEGQPFFSVFNFGVTHEAQIFDPAPTWNLRYDRDTFPPDRNVDLVWKKFPDGVQKNLAVPADLEVPLPPYLPATDVVIKDIRRMYSNIVEMDRFIGTILKQLEEDGLLEETIVVWFTDHGGPLPRQKRLLYDSGLHVPLIIRNPRAFRSGTTDDQLISFVDFAPSLLSMAGIKAPAQMEGSAFTGKYASEESRKYIHAAADRFDEHYDMIRAVRNNRYKYLRNFKPEQGYYLPLEFRERMTMMQEMLKLRDEGKLDEVQMQWFRNTKPEEELFDTWADPHELNNIASDPEYHLILSDLRNECKRWMDDGDMGFMEEMEMIENFWPGRVQPKTATPSITLADGLISAACTTEGAAIGYQFPEDDLDWKGWRIYSQPFETDVSPVRFVAHRLGYAPSDTVVFTR